MCETVWITLNSLKLSKTVPLLQGIISLKIFENQFYKKGNLRLKVTFHVVPSTGFYTHVRNFPCQTLKISKVSLVVMGHNDRPCRRPAPGRPIGHPGSGCPQGVIGVFNLHILTKYTMSGRPWTVKSNTKSSWRARSRSNWICAKQSESL
jgi:hypothetical protein